MTLPHSDFNAVLCAARFETWGMREPYLSMVAGRIHEDRDMRFDDGSLIYTSYIVEKHWVSDGEWVVRTRNSLYHVFEIGYKGLQDMPASME